MLKLEMTQRLFRIAVAALLAAVAAPAAAQDWSRPDPTLEPWRDARLRIGPLFFNPNFQLRDLGIDQNVFNDVPGAERRDRAVLPQHPEQIKNVAGHGAPFGL